MAVGQRRMRVRKRKRKKMKDKPKMFICKTGWVLTSTYLS
jgi:hypothetical protein